MDIKKCQLFVIND